MTRAPDRTTQTSSRPRKRKKKPCDSKAYSAFMVTMSRNYEKRAKDDGIDALYGVAAAQAALNEATTNLISFLMSEEGGSHSWTEVSRALGVSRQAAQQRFRIKGARKPGGQPANLR